jgi:phage repressor protein C with HTH and peptisase S24 domain
MLAVGNFALIKNMRSSRSADKRYNFQALERLANVLDLECYFGPRREPATEVLVLGVDDYVPVPRIDVRLSAGPGVVNHEPAEVERLAFRLDWLKRLGVKPPDAVLVGISGDSMSPGLRDGDIALIDRGRRTVRTGNVYAFTDTDGSTRVKRVDIVPGEGFVLRSDAPEYPVELRLGLDAKALRIEGQVVWSGHVWER